MPGQFDTPRNPELKDPSMFGSTRPTVTRNGPYDPFYATREQEARRRLEFDTLRAGSQEGHSPEASRFLRPDQPYDPEGTSELQESREMGGRCVDSCADSCIPKRMQTSTTGTLQGTKKAVSNAATTAQASCLTGIVTKPDEHTEG